MIAGSRQEGLRLLPSAGCSRGRWYAQSLSTSALCVWVDAGGSPPSTVHERGVPHAGMKGRGRRWKPAPRPVSRAVSRSGEKAPRAQSQVLGFVFQIFNDVAHEPLSPGRIFPRRHLRAATRCGRQNRRRSRADELKRASFVVSQLESPRQSIFLSFTPHSRRWG